VFTLVAVTGFYFLVGSGRTGSQDGIIPNARLIFSHCNQETLRHLVHPS